ncbi:hypothetical protein [Janthinobacterium sp. 17J80-10]|uniref:hypothetical protein n=1 Tax=Janthinobacterium sp. 17J80-10 TaxID=2497863 RepID=UPI00100531EF|nr:hypothetical protein [Janthinobacterium sp. 17J80-10]QAU33686.1 hypothetical protein EKL02_05515 [Janthinobacterium sp. 17J80-10]
MILARWSIDARFGHKQTVIDFMVKWQKEIGSAIGWTEARILTGSVGAKESTVQAEILLKDLGELSASWDKLATNEAHKQWGKDLEPFIVSGTPKWEIFRIVADSASLAK